MSDAVVTALIAEVQSLHRRLSSLEAAEYVGQASSLKPWFDVKRYGATGDGAADDRAKFAAAVADCATAGGGVVHVPSGTYLVDTDSYADAISLPSNCHLMMAPDAVLQLATLDAGDNNHAVFRINGADNVHVSGGEIVGQRTGPSSGENGFAFYITGGSTNVLIENVHISDMWGDGIYIGGTLNSHVTVRKCWIENCRRQGITIVNAENVTIEDNTIEDINGTNPQAGIDVEPNAGQSVSDVRIICNRIENCVGSEIYLNRGLGDAVTDCIVQSNRIDGRIACSGTEECIVANNRAAQINSQIDENIQIVGNTVKNSPSYGIYHEGGAGGACVNNIIISPADHGIYWRHYGGGGYYPWGGVIADNYVYNPANGGTSAQGNGINVQYARNLSIKGNVVELANLSGIYLAFCESLQVAKNILAGCGQQSGSTYSGIQLMGSSSKCNIQGNTIRDSIARDTGTAQAGTDNTIQLATTAHSVDDWYNGLQIAITGGTGSGQSKTITDYVGSTRTATVDSDWATNPDATSTYEVGNAIRTYYGIRIATGCVGNLVTNNDLLEVNTPLSDAGTGTVTTSGNRTA